MSEAVGSSTRQRRGNSGGPDGSHRGRDNLGNREYGDDDDVISTCPDPTTYYDDSHDEAGLEGVDLLASRLTQRPVLALLEERLKRLMQEQRKSKIRDVSGQLKRRWLRQQERIVARAKAMATKLRSGRSRAWRHKWNFVFVQFDLIATAFVLGRWPSKYYLYYSALMAYVLPMKALTYGLTLQHYFLVDFCYFANTLFLCWLWLWPLSPVLFNAAAGTCGVLALSVVLFRNSCVPHDIARTANAYVHIPAIICMTSINMACEGQHCIGMHSGESLSWYIRVRDAWLAYLVWAIVYAGVIFIIFRKRIATRKRDTLYNYVAVELGYQEKLPLTLRPYAPMVFMWGHQALFLFGVGWMFLPLHGQVVATILTLTAFFRNGGTFYVDHFWKAYEKNAAAYIDAACTAMSAQEPVQEASGCHSDES